MFGVIVTGVVLIPFRLEGILGVDLRAGEPHSLPLPPLLSMESLPSRQTVGVFNEPPTWDKL